MKKHIAMSIVLLLCLTGCQHNNPHNTLKDSQNAVYFWQTWFDPDVKETDFLCRNNIRTIYLRFFDVDINPEEYSNDKCAPVATVNFNERLTLPRIEIIPVVFITTEAIKEYDSFTDDLAHRIYAMCKRNSIIIKEVQFDCDWTPSTRDAYFQFLVDVRKALKAYFGKEIAVSSTIRLHQLAQAPPEVDYGVLMCYNTGDFKDFDTENSILDVKDVQKYVKRLKDYPLPLKLALPDYSWDVEFDGNHQFVRLNRQNEYGDLIDTTHLKRVKGNMYAISPVGEEETTKFIRREIVSAETILKAKALVEKYYGKLPVVLYHLDSKQLSKYTDDELSSFFD